MKILTMLAIFYCLTSTVTMAQFNAGAGIAYGTEIESAGFHFRAGYLISDRINLTGDVYFFFNRQETDLEREWRELNINARYRIYASERFFVYPLAGFNLSTITTRFDQANGAPPVIVRESAPGINAGGGLGFRVNSLTPFLETKYIFGDHQQGVFTLGVLYIIGRRNQQVQKIYLRRCTCLRSSSETFR